MCMIQTILTRVEGVYGFQSLQHLAEFHFFAVGTQDIEVAHAVGPEGQGLDLILQGGESGGLYRGPGGLHVVHVQGDVVDGAGRSPPQSSLGSTSMRTFMVVSWWVSMYS